MAVACSGRQALFRIMGQQYWTPENNAKYPGHEESSVARVLGGGASSFWLRNGAYLRLKNLDLALCASQKMAKARIGVNSVRSLPMLPTCSSGMKEHDPEQTLDSYPLMKTFTGRAYINYK